LVFYTLFINAQYYYSEVKNVPYWKKRWRVKPHPRFSIGKVNTTKPKK